jgi:hypothetical protein
MSDYYRDLTQAIANSRDSVAQISALILDDADGTAALQHCVSNALEGSDAAAMMSY